jgi:hypothetical protein
MTGLDIRFAPREGGYRYRWVSMFGGRLQRAAGLGEVKELARRNE